MTECEFSRRGCASPQLGKTAGTLSIDGDQAIAPPLTPLSRNRSGTWRRAHARQPAGRWFARVYQVAAVRKPSLSGQLR